MQIYDDKLELPKKDLDLINARYFLAFIKITIVRNPHSPRNNIALLPNLGMKRRFRLARPPLQLGQFIDQEYSCSLRLSTGLHNPRALRILAVLLDKHVVIGRQDERYRDKVQIEVLWPSRNVDLGLFRERVPITLEVFAVAFDVFDEQIFPRELVVVGEVVDQLVVVHPVAAVHAEDVTTRSGASPVKVPIVVGGNLHPAALLEVADQHRLVQIRTEAYLHPFVTCSDSWVEKRDLRGVIQGGSRLPRRIFLNLVPLEVVIYNVVRARPVAHNRSTLFETRWLNEPPEIGQTK